MVTDKTWTDVEEQTFADQNKNIAVVKPKSYKDVESAIAILKDGNDVILYLTKLKAEDAQRVSDLMSGAACALDGTIYEIETDVYMVSTGGRKIINNG